MQSKPLLLDGSMGQEIVNRGGKSAYGEWAVAALHENPHIISEIHRDYITAGADVITTNTYSTTRTRLVHVGKEDRFAELVQLAGQLAVDACDAAGRPEVQIAASLGPLEASYIPASEFTLSFAEMVAQYDEMMRLLTPYVDIFLGETYSNSIEARAFLTAAQQHTKTVWISYSLNDHAHNTLRGGEPLTEALTIAADFSPDAILLNCCKPETVDQRIRDLQQTKLAFGAYANGFTDVPATWVSDGDVQDQISAREDMTPAIYTQHAQTWIAQGASIVGGCCDIGPQHIAHLRKSLDSIASNTA